MSSVGYPCPSCGTVSGGPRPEYMFPPWCYCRNCQTMFNPEHTGIAPVEPQTEAAAPADPEPAAEAATDPPKDKRTMAPRPDPNTPFTDDDLAKLPNWAQGKVRYLNAQLVRVLEQLASAPAPEPVTGDAQSAEGVLTAKDADGRPAYTPPLGLTVSEDGDLLNWEGENYVRQSELVAVRYTAGARLARIAELVSEGLEELAEPEGDGDEDE